MIVVADNSPLVVLNNLSEIEVLPKHFRVLHAGNKAANILAAQGRETSCSWTKGRKPSRKGREAQVPLRWS